jgi:hypothetical protein
MDLHFLGIEDRSRPLLTRRDKILNLPHPCRERVGSAAAKSAERMKTEVRAKSRRARNDAAKH